MVTKALLPLGALVAVLLSALLLLGVALELWLLTAAAGCALVSASLLVGLDAWRRVRALRSFVRDEIRRQVVPQARTPGVVESTAPAAGVAPDDVVDVVRLLQAQYVGRLDRLQASVESLIEHDLATRDVAGSSSATVATGSPGGSAADPTR